MAVDYRIVRPVKLSRAGRSERALRTFTIGRKNWMTLNTVRGAQASAMIYSITETARAMV